MLFLYLHFKFNELRFKGITNHSYKCMVIIIPQLQKIMFMYVYHTRNIKTFGTYLSVKYKLNGLIVQHIDGCSPLFIRVIL